MSNEKNTASKRLHIYLQQNRNYQFFIGYPLNKPRKWIKIINSEQDELFSDQGEIFSIKDVISFVVSYESGEILDGEFIIKPLPHGLHYINHELQKQAAILIPESLKLGNKILKISHKREKNENRNNYHSTTLINLYAEKVRVKKFAAYSPHGKAYVLNTITGGYFSEQNFREWYEVDKDGWIKPGQILVDPNNYSSGKCYWAYFGITESDQEFVAARLFEEQKCWWNLW